MTTTTTETERGPALRFADGLAAAAVIATLSRWPGILERADSLRGPSATVVSNRRVVDAASVTLAALRSRRASLRNRRLPRRR
jgi:hypothetical protein